MAPSEAVYASQGASAPVVVGGSGGFGGFGGGFFCRRFLRWLRWRRRKCRGDLDHKRFDIDIERWFGRELDIGRFNLDGRQLDGRKFDIDRRQLDLGRFDFDIDRRHFFDHHQLDGRIVDLDQFGCHVVFDELGRDIVIDQHKLVDERQRPFRRPAEAPRRVRAARHRPVDTKFRPRRWSCCSDWTQLRSLLGVSWHGANATDRLHRLCPVAIAPGHV